MSIKIPLLVSIIGNRGKNIYFFFDADNMAFDTGTNNAITLTLSRPPTQQEVDAAVA